MMNVNVNKIKATAILDTGSTFSLIPHAVWLELNLNPNKLDQTVKYNINSASHKNENAVLGTTKLSFAIKDIKGIWQCIEHKCLILRPALQLAHILLETISSQQIMGCWLSQECAKQHSTVMTFLFYVIKMHQTRILFILFSLPINDM